MMRQICLVKLGGFFVLEKLNSRRISYDEKKESRKSATQFFALLGAGYRIYARDGYDGTCRGAYRGITYYHHGNGPRTGQLQHRECCNHFVQLYSERFLKLLQQWHDKLGMVGIRLVGHRQCCRRIYHHQMRIL